VTPKVIGIVRVVSLLCAAVVMLPASALAADRYVSAAVDEAGALRIVTSDGRTIVQTKEPEHHIPFR